MPSANANDPLPAALCCPDCQQLLAPDSNGEVRCSGCRASFRLVPVPSTATLSVLAPTDPQATIDVGTTVMIRGNLTTE